MNGPLVLAQLDDNRGGLLLFLLFVVLPLLARLVRWLGERAGLVQPAKPEAGAERADPREELRRRRAERKATEVEGEDLWRRLARGEVAEAPLVPVPVPAPARTVSPEQDLVPEPSEVRAESLEREEEPAPLSVLGEVLEPGQAPETSLESEAEPAPLGALDQAAAPSGAALPQALARRGAFGREDWRRAIVLAEVLGPPVSERA